MPIALALKFGDSVKPLIDCRLSSPFGNGASTVSGHTDAELFQVRRWHVEARQGAVGMMVGVVVVRAGCWWVGCVCPWWRAVCNL